MDLINDPSIHPVTTTDLEGNILQIRTIGLQFYGFYDIVMDRNFEEYKAIFQYIVDSVCSLSFDYDSQWYFNGKVVRLQIEQDGLAYIRYVEGPTILTVKHSLNNESLRHQTIGLWEAYNHPEIHMDAKFSDSYEYVDYAVLRVKEGFRFDDNHMIVNKSRTIDVIRSIDRYGQEILELKEML